MWQTSLVAIQSSSRCTPATSTAKRKTSNLAWEQDQYICVSTSWIVVCKGIVKYMLTDDS